MRRILKRALSVLLAVTMVFGTAAFGFSDVDWSDFAIKAKAATSGYYTYTVSGGNATITDVSESISGNIIIPSTLDGYPVTSIGDSAFYNCSSLTSITISDSVTSIGYRAFYYCSSLTSITVDSANTSYSSDEYGVLFNKDKTELVTYPSGNKRTNYTIPDSVTSIGSWVFIDCDSLTNITIPDSVTSIDSWAFFDCDSLTSITIGDSVTSIGFYAFYDCDSLTSITIPDSVTSIGYNAFSDCDSLTDVYYTGTEAEWNKISIGYGNYELLNANIHFNGSAKKTFPDGYNFDEDSYGFNNPTCDELDKRYFAGIYGYAKGNLMYDEHKGAGSNGLCFGMAYTTASILEGYPNISDISNNGKPCENLRDANEKSMVKIGDGLYITLLDYIKYAYVYQFSWNSLYQKSYNELASSDVFEDAVNNNSYLVMDIVTRGLGNHTVLVVGYEEVSDNKDVIYIDDSNFTLFTNSRKLHTLTFENDDFTYSNNWADEEINMSNTKYIAFHTDYTRPYHILETGHIVLTDDDLCNFVEGMDPVDQDKILLEISSLGCLFDAEDYLSVSDVTGNAGEGEAEQNGNLYWIANDKSVTISDIKDDNTEISLAGNDVLLNSVVDEGAVVTMTIDENETSILVDADNGEEYTASFETYDENGTEVTITLNGTSSGEEIKVVETEDGINITGAESGTVTLTVDEEVVSEYTFGNAQGDIGIEYDKTAESGNMEIVYENSLGSLGDIIGDFEIENKGTLNIAPEIAIENCTFSYSSSDSDVVTVDESGNVRAENIGTATITCTVTDEYGNTYSDTCSVSVLPRRFSLIWNVDGVETAETIEEGAAIAVPTPPEKEGYRFVGWTPEVPEVMPAEDLVFTAVFEEIEPDIPEEPSEPATEPTTVPEETTTQPVVTEPATTQPVEVTTTQPVTEPSTTQPTTVAPTEPATEPTSVPEEITTQPVVTEPATTTPVEVTTTQPVTEPSTTQPTTVAPTEPATELTTAPEETTTKPVVTEPDFVVEIRKPSQTEIKYGDSIVLHAEVENLPEGVKIEWSADNGNFTIVEVSADGMTCRVTPASNGDTVFTAKVVDTNGNEVVKDEQTMTSKAGFFRKIIAFFKKLFGLTEVIPEVFKGII